MRSGPTPPENATAAAQVTVAGVLRDVESVSTERHLGGGGIPGMSDVAAASGSAAWSDLVAVRPDGAVRPSPVRPVDGWPPARRSAVTVAMGTEEAGVYSAFTGVLDSTECSDGGAMTSTFVDPIDRMRRNVNVPPMQALMPPATEGAPLLRVGLSSDYIVDLILRSCVIYTTPNLSSGKSGVSVPGQGSMWPARGTCTAAAAQSDATISADFATSQWGWGITDVDASYAPSGTLTASAGFEFSCMVSAAHAASASVTAYLTGRSEYYKLFVTSSRMVQLIYYDGTTATTVLSLPAASGWTRVTGRFSATNATLSTDDGRSTSGTYSSNSGVTTAAVSSVRILADPGSLIGGVTVSNNDAGYYNGVALNGRIYAGTVLNPKLRASPAMVNVNALETVAQIADATCRAWWWTEDGVFQWKPGDVLLGQSPVTTLASSNGFDAGQLASVGWSEALTDTFSKVVVEYEAPGISRSVNTGVEVWRGGSQTTQGTDEQFITAPSDEDWFYVGQLQQLLTGTISAFNAGPGSWYGATTDAGALVSDASLSVTLEAITSQTWKLKTYATAVYDQKVPDLAAVKKWKQGESLPVLRARSRTTWAPVSASFGSGPSDAPEYRHDAGRWVQGYGASDAVDSLGGFLAQWLCIPHPRVPNVRIVHDGRISVGDVVTLDDSYEFGVRWTVLVTGVTQTTSDSAQDMTIDCFVISAVPLGITYGELDAANAGKTYGQLDAANADRTYGAFDAAPVNA